MNERKILCTSTLLALSLNTRNAPVSGFFGLLYKILNLSPSFSITSKPSRSMFAAASLFLFAFPTATSLASSILRALLTGATRSGSINLQHNKGLLHFDEI
jgi:predicted membrane metal-binding protein